MKSIKLQAYLMFLSSMSQRLTSSGFVVVVVVVLFSEKHENEGGKL